jgi:hypothetical protein
MSITALAQLAVPSADGPKQHGRMQRLRREESNARPMIAGMAANTLVVERLNQLAPCTEVP